MKDSIIKKLVNNIRATLLLITVFFCVGQVGAKEVSQEQLQQLQKIEQSDNKVILLDVRTVEEFNDGHIANAVNIPHKELANRLAELSGAEDTQIIMYCRSGRRVEIATQILKENGFKQLDHLTGDFNAWSSNNLPIKTGK